MVSSKKNKKILVTGSEGYIGSVLVPMLINNGFSVVGFDTCFFKEGHLTGNNFANYKLINKDIRDVNETDLEEMDAVVHLAALSNDPLGMLNEDLTYDINYVASVKLARLTREIGISKFIFSSSCSLYGASDKVLTENDKANPQTPYGRSKIYAENDISELADSEFSPTFLRNATAYGISPRMRFDLVVNSLTGYAKTENEIKILGDGTPWRPLVNVKDICQTIIKVLNSPKELVHNEAFNVGGNLENYQIKTIAEMVKKIYGSCAISIKEKNSSDTRNYAVSFDKLNNQLGYHISISLEEGIMKIAESYEKIKLNSEIFNSRFYTRLKQIEYLQNQKKINKQLRWN